MFLGRTHSIFKGIQAFHLYIYSFLPTEIHFYIDYKLYVPNYCLMTVIKQTHTGYTNSLLQFKISVQTLCKFLIKLRQPIKN